MASRLSRMTSPSSRRRFMRAVERVLRIDRVRGASASEAVVRATSICWYVADSSISRCICFTLQPRAMNSPASQSSSSGCVGGCAVDAEVARRRDEAAAEVVLPEAVDHDARGQRIRRRGDPVAPARRAGRSFAAAATSVRVRRAGTSGNAGCDFLARLAVLAACSTNVFGVAPCVVLQAPSRVGSGGGLGSFLHLVEQLLRARASSRRRRRSTSSLSEIVDLVRGLEHQVRLLGVALVRRRAVRGLRFGRELRELLLRRSARAPALPARPVRAPSDAR